VSGSTRSPAPWLCRRELYDGTVVAVEVVAGEYASAGEVLVVVNDLSRLLVETTDLSERDVPGVSLGQEATVHVEALDQDLPGRVTAISHAAEILGGGRGLPDDPRARVASSGSAARHERRGALRPG